MSLAVIITACVFATSAISGALGMAGGMILMGCLVSLLPVAAAIIIHAAAQFVSNASRAVLHRRFIVWRALRFYVIGMALAVAMMALVAFVPGKAAVFLLLGILPFAQLALARKIEMNILRPGHGIACGFFSTLLHLGGGVAGMLVDVFFQRSGLTRHQMIASKATAQVLSHAVRIVYFSLLAGGTGTGFSDISALGIGALGIGAIVIASICGTAVSGRLLDALSDRNFRKITQGVLLVLGAVYLVRGLMLLAA